MFADKWSPQPSRTNKFQFLIPEQVQVNLPHHILLEEKEVGRLLGEFEPH